MSQTTQPDITAFDRNGQTVLMVEAKAVTGTSREWASVYRRNLAANGFLPKVPFFLIATPDHFYLWKNAPEAGVVIEPDYDINPAECLDPYYTRSHIEPESVQPEAFELIIAAWLADVQRETAVNGAPKPGHRWMADSGLLAALRGGRVVLQAAIQ
jgi:hypothetical protein